MSTGCSEYLDYRLKKEQESNENCTINFITCICSYLLLEYLTRKMKYVWHVVWTVEQNSYRILARKPEWKKLLARARHRWVGNAKKDHSFRMQSMEGYYDHSNDHVPYDSQKCLCSWANISLWRGALPVKQFPLGSGDIGCWSDPIYELSHQRLTWILYISLIVRASTHLQTLFAKFDKNRTPHLQTVSRVNKSCSMSTHPINQPFSSIMSYSEFETGIWAAYVFL